jgi:Leucine-rich repeat (LRR) protein
MNQIPFPYDINTISIRIVNKKLREVPPWIQQLVNLEELILDMNRISEIPDWLGDLPLLKTLSLSNNTISTISNLKNLQNLILNNNHIRNIDCIQYMTNLESLNVSGNMIDSIPSEIFDNCINLVEFSINYNYLTTIPSNICNLVHLKELSISYNDLITLPIQITHLIHIDYFYYKNNPYEYFPPQVQRFLHRVKNNINNIYNDSQSVHTTSIQTSITKSIENIMNQPLKKNMDDIIEEIYLDPLITTKKIIEEYVKNEDVHSILQVTFKELLCYVWETINSINNDEIKIILNCEILESHNKCFTGRISRLVNCLSGFTNLVSITIDASEEIANVITVEQYKLVNYTSEQHKENVIKELTERGYDNEIISQWVQFL